MADQSTPIPMPEPFIDAEAWDRVDVEFDNLVQGLRRQDIIKWMYPASGCGIWPLERLTPTRVYE